MLVICTPLWFSPLRECVWVVLGGSYLGYVVASSALQIFHHGDACLRDAALLARLLLCDRLLGILPMIESQRWLLGP